jgi:hypothetical protein
MAPTGSETPLTRLTSSKDVEEMARRPGGTSAVRLVALGLAACLLAACAGADAPTRPGRRGAAAPPRAPEPVAPAIAVGALEVDPPTFHCLGLSLSVEGDDNYNATATVSYREPGGAWREALPLIRVRPDTLPDADTDDRIGFTVRPQFAGSIVDLTPGATYEVRVEVQDPDGGGATRTVTTATRALPPAAPAAPRPVRVASADALRAALAGAQPGDVITLAPGQYAGAVAIERSGTRENPIVVRGEDARGVVLDATGARAGLSILGSYVTVEGLTVVGSVWGMRVADAEGVVIRHAVVSRVANGINAAGDLGDDGRLRGHRNRNLTICDNVLEGREVVWPNTDRSVWNFEGIVVRGSGHVVCHNTLSGFGDSMGMDRGYREGRRMEISRDWYAEPNRGIDFFGNDVRWGGDDGIELDLAERNVRAYRNRLTNVASGISFQPVWGGPAYAFRNVIYNAARSPYKLNNDPSGVLILHNTSVKAELAWYQYEGSVSNLRVYNNVVVGAGKPEGRGTGTVVFATRIRLSQFDWNGWFPPGRFRFDAKWPSLDALRGGSPYERHGVMLAEPIFEPAVEIPTRHTTLRPPPADFTLHPRSRGIDAGVRLPNFNDGFAGAAPDLGARERGEPPFRYGPRPRS